MAVTLKNNVLRANPQTSMGSTYPGRRAQKRREARERSSGRVRNPVKDTHVIPAKINGARSSSLGRLSKGLLYASLAIGVHGSIVLGLSSFDGAHGPNLDLGKSNIEKVTVKVEYKPLPERDESTPVAEDTKEDDRVAVRDLEEPIAPKKVKRKNFAKAGKTRSELPKNIGPQADPVDFDRTAAPEPEGEPRRRVVGISFESTVKGGAGPSFAIGNTRMGETASRAEEAGKIGKLGPEEIRVGDKDDVGPNRAASVIPSSRKTFTKPKRINDVDLQYPRTLKEQGIEGNVVVLIRISSDGKVTRVKVLKSSGYPEFDDAATRAATSERFAPATRDGDPVDYSLKYTYRFRIRQA